MSPVRAVTSWFSTWPESAPAGLDPKVKAALAAQGPAPDYRSQGPALVRSNFNALAASVPKVEEPILGVVDSTIGDGVRTRMYIPEGGGPFPACLYFHGGGWVVGDLESHDHVCRSLASRAKAVVVSVDYRLAPEHRYPIALEDCLTALRWLASTEATRISVCGDSAGANLAAGLAIRVRDGGGPRIASQLLLYPVTDRNFETVSYREYASGYGLTRANMQWFWECYYPGADLEPTVAPLRTKSLKGLPPAHVITAEYDVLRDEGEAYARRLHKEGVPVRGTRYLGLNHGFIRMAAVYPQADRAITELAETLRSGFVAAGGA